MRLCHGALPHHRATISKAKVCELKIPRRIFLPLSPGTVLDLKANTPSHEISNFLFQDARSFLRAEAPPTPADHVSTSS